MDNVIDETAEQVWNRSMGIQKSPTLLMRIFRWSVIFGPQAL
jgi:hypothetical protein